MLITWGTSVQQICHTKMMTAVQHTKANQVWR